MLFGETFGRQINQISGLNIYVAVIALGLYTASRVAEHMRAGFASISADQYQAVIERVDQLRLEFQLVNFAIVGATYVG